MADSTTDLSAETRDIRTETHPNCPLCGALGDVLYERLRDTLFGAPGTWGFRRCTHTGCRHLWLDPRPIEADLPLVYERYYTHEAPPVTAAHSLPLKLIYAAIVVFLRLSGILSEREKLHAMYLTDRTPGRLLEIGCGSGKRLADFAKRGWHVMGQDIDPKAVDNARKTHGVTVHLGPIESLPESLGTFDAVIMSHVIEHVSDPVELLRQAVARLAPGGVLVAVTPNAESLLHRWFKGNWRGLEPPRHLHLFGPQSLEDTARRALLPGIRIITTAAQALYFAQASLIISREHDGPGAQKPRFWIDALSLCLQIVASLYRAVRRSSGEECVLISEVGPPEFSFRIDG